MAQFVKLNLEALSPLRDIDERLVSYNIEMTEVTGGTFWKAYTDAQIDGTEEFPVIKDWSNMGNLQQWYDPIDTTNARLIKLAKELGTAWVRVSGTWANKTYYDFDGKYEGKVPEGFQNVLTKKQWFNLLDFEKGTAEIIRLADWDTIKTIRFANKAIAYLLNCENEKLPTETIFSFET